MKRKRRWTKSEHNLYKDIELEILQGSTRARAFIGKAFLLIYSEVSYRMMNLEL